MFPTSHIDNNSHNSNNSEEMLIPNLSPMDVAEYVKVMRKQEETTYKCEDVLSLPFLADQDDHPVVVDADCRAKMCEWCHQVIDFCKFFHHETVDICMNFLDRFLASRTPEALKAMRNRQYYQLASMTTLYMAIKLHEPTKMSAGLVAELSRGEYTEADIVEMEQHVLLALQWRVNGPTRLGFCLLFLALLPQQLQRERMLVETVMELTRFQTELATRDYYFTTRRQSTAAVACILNALEAVGDASVMSKQYRDAFLQSIANFGGINPFSAEVEEARTRLAECAGCSFSHMLPQRGLASVSSPVSTVKTSSYRIGSDSEKSPVCVSRR